MVVNGFPERLLVFVLVGSYGFSFHNGILGLIEQLLWSWLLLLVDDLAKGFELLVVGAFEEVIDLPVVLFQEVHLVFVEDGEELAVVGAVVDVHLILENGLPVFSLRLVVFVSHLLEPGGLDAVVLEEPHEGLEVATGDKRGDCLHLVVDDLRGRASHILRVLLAGVAACLLLVALRIFLLLRRVLLLLLLGRCLECDIALFRDWVFSLLILHLLDLALQCLHGHLVLLLDRLYLLLVLFHLR